nr:anhydro-N-acetylmuramic acid kinase [Ulvibacter litoralis]
MKKNSYHVVGVMSGTSLDGIDLCEIVFTFSETNAWSFELFASETVAYPSTWKQKLQEAVSHSEAALETLNLEYTEYLSEVILTFVKKHTIKNLDAVCSHGHTILHQPANGITLQIGNLPKLAKLIQQTVVCDFRVEDVALGGQGAPLVPIGDALLFKEYDYCLNLGGFANCSFERNGERIAYDICPVNIVLNPLAEAYGKPYDDGGEMARHGKFSLSLSSALREIPYYKLLPPKSLGLEWVQNEFLPILNNKRYGDAYKLRTVTDHIAAVIARQFNKGSKVLVTGGGAYNRYLLEMIKRSKDVALIVPDAKMIEFKEALIFGLLGVLKLRNEVNCLASVTGASKDHSGGMIFFA